MLAQNKSQEGLGDCRVRFSANESTDSLLWTTVQAIEMVGCSRAAAVKKMMMLGWMALQGVDVRTIATPMLCNAKLPDFEQIAGYPLLDVAKPNYEPPQHKRENYHTENVAKAISEQKSTNNEPVSVAPANNEELLFNIGNLGTLV